jgi:hypothetical protein
LIKIYYELEDFDLFEANSNSFKILLNRLKLASEYQKTIYKNFIRFSTYLFKIKDGNVKRKSKWITQIKETTEVADNTWIQEKVNELAETA